MEFSQEILFSEMKHTSYVPSGFKTETELVKLVGLSLVVSPEAETNCEDIVRTEVKRGV